MSSIGAALPPHLLAKRKRQLAEASKAGEASDGRTGSSDQTASQAQDVQSKKPRIAGPALPPAPIEQMPERRPTDGATKHVDDAEDSDSSDDFGPAAPSSAAAHEATLSRNAREDASTEAEGEPKLRRDEWMTMPPTQDGLAARMDPTKQRPKGFSTGKGAKASNADNEGGSAWHETPEQKKIRLQNEMMGVSTTSAAAGKRVVKSTQEQQNVKIKQQLEKHSGPSLMDMHKESKNLAEVEDDPSKRAFDREKDMGSGARISASQKRQMVSKAADFSRFSGGSFL